MGNKNRWFRHTGILLPAVLIASFILNGCGQRVDNTNSTDKTTETTAQTTTAQTEQVTEAAAAETESVTETENLITSVDYTSKDGSIKITLPDNTWKVTQDTDEMRVFQSGNKAIINIQHATTDTAMQSLKVYTSEDDLKENLDSQYTSDNAYEVQSFTSSTLNNVNVYKYVVKFNADERMWAYSDTYAIIATDQAYVITGTVTDDNTTLLKAVEDSVDSFRVLKDETLKQVTSEKLVGTTQKTSETTASTDAGSTAADELKTETTYNAVSMTTSDVTNVRTGPGTDTSLLTTLDTDTTVSVIGETTNWYKVSVNGSTGYIRKDLLTASGSTAQTTTSSSSDTTASSDSSSAELNTATTYGSSSTLYATDGVNIRSNPSTASSVISSLSTGDSVTVVGETDNWYIVSVNGTTGYISKSYLTSDSSAASSGSSTSSTSGSSTSSSSSSTSTSTSSLSQISGTVESSGTDTMTIITDDGSEYTIYYGDASVSSTDGIYDGVYVDITLNASEAASDGTLYATSVTGY